MNSRMIGKCSNFTHTKYKGEDISEETFEYKGCWSCYHFTYDEDFPYYDVEKAFLKFTEDPIINLQILVDTAGTLLNADCAMYNTIISSNSKESLKTLAIYQEPPEFIKESYAIGHICTDVIKDNRDEIIIIRDLDKTKYAISDENVN